MSLFAGSAKIAFRTGRAPLHFFPDADMTTDTLLLILTGLCAFLAAAVVWLVLEMRLLKIQTSENLRRDA